MKNELELNLSASAVQALKRSMDMGMGCSLGIGLSGQVFVSGGADAISDAVLNSTGPAFSLDASNTAQIGGISDGASVTTLSLNNDNWSFTTSVPGAWTWNAAESAISADGSSRFGGEIAPSESWGSNKDCYVVLKTSDAAWMLADSKGNLTHFFGIAENGQASAANVNVGTPTMSVNGVAIGASRDNLHDAAATGQYVVVAIRGLDLTQAQWTNGLLPFAYEPNTAFNFNGFFKHYMVVDAQDNDGAAAIIAQLTARHGVT